MHDTQIKILQLAKNTNISNLTLRKIGELIGVEHPQKIQHHLTQLERKGLLQNREATKPGKIKGCNLIRIPIMPNYCPGWSDWLKRNI